MRIHLERVDGAVDPEEVRQILAQQLEPDTLAHVFRTVEVAKVLAARHGIDPARAEVAALLHEIGEPYNDKEMLALARHYNLDIDDTEQRIPRLLHGKLGAAILRDRWDIQDEELLEAVRLHISAGPHMGTLAKIIFVADKLEPDRDKFYGDLNAIRELAETNLDAAIAKLSAWRLDKLGTDGPGPRRRNTLSDEWHKITESMDGAGRG